MYHTIWLLVIAGLLAAAIATADHGLRPPAVPLVACDPYFSIWSCADKLTDDTTRHWTGTEHSLSCLIRIDDNVYCLMGKDLDVLPAAEQTGLKVLPTRTMYTFKTPEATITLTFMTPQLPDDLDVLSRPVTYVTWDVKPVDAKKRDIRLYFDAAAEIAVNSTDQPVVWSRPAVSGLDVMCVGSQEQPVLQKKGDNLRIDWGHLYLAAPHEQGAQMHFAARAACMMQFIKLGGFNQPDTAGPVLPSNDEPVTAFCFKVGPNPGHLILAYDDEYSIEYFHHKLRPFWRRNGWQAADLLRASEADYVSLTERCRTFDEALMADLTKAGGAKYAQICALAYRQCNAANKLCADANGKPLLFPKECFSNGCIATVDVIYPMGPQFLFLSPTLAKASLVPILVYACSDRWKWPFAPHDLGTYPKANGQVYGGGERTEENQMPVEESGNMLLLLAAIAKTDGNADFVKPYWPAIAKWAAYLKEKGLDPENQLCTDDFAGHLAHNVNLSAKAILALGAYAQLCEMRGEHAEAQAYRQVAQEDAKRWAEMANDGDHFRLAFDKPGTWSQKYNFVWDRILGLNLFPTPVVAKEIAFYRSKLNRFGLPLDVRQAYTKLDWTLWSATLTGKRDDFDALAGPVYDFLNETPDRVPMTDWFATDSAKCVGFRARSVVGGVFVRMLDDSAVWRKWAKRGKPESGWAPFPSSPKLEVVLPCAQQGGQTWRYTFEQPSDAWYQPTIDDSGWKEGRSGFGTEDTPGAVIGTVSNTPDIWLRREFALPEGKFGDVRLWMHHDEDAQVYLNGKVATRVRGFTSDYDEFDIRPDALATLKPGKNTLAVHCYQTTGGQYIDVGLVRER